jgi:L-asparaginase/beta-aspartyl-peptidase (threonine type)
MSDNGPTPVVIVHGGVSAPASHQDGCEEAAAAGLAVLAGGGAAIDAVVEATRHLEDDDRFNAGHGSRLRLDGSTIQMDAAVMDSDGGFGAVAAVSDVPNPIIVARRLVDAPPMILAGEGASRFAARHGLTGDVRVTDAARSKFRHMAALASRGKLGREYSAWRRFDLAANWNYETPFPDFAAVAREEDPNPDDCDTVGAVALDARGGFAASSSTGGTALMLLGRVGDSPLPGCGLYAGPAGAVTATGEGEEIISRLLSKWVYDRMASGITAQAACDDAITLFPADIVIGVLGVTRTGHGCAANRAMPWAMAGARPA